MAKTRSPMRLTLDATPPGWERLGSVLAEARAAGFEIALGAEEMTLTKGYEAGDAAKMAGDAEQAQRFAARIREAFTPAPEAPAVVATANEKTGKTGTNNAPPVDPTAPPV